MTIDFDIAIAGELGVRHHQVARSTELFDADNTLPFIARYCKQDGLVHVGQMAGRYVKDPLTVVSVDDVVKVKAISVDQERGRIWLIMKDVG